MEGLIILGVIVYGIYHLMGGGCEHNWLYDGSQRHKCKKCGTKEKCTIELDVVTRICECTTCYDRVV